MDNAELRNRVTSISGFFVGSLTEEEMADFEEACRQGIATRWYDGAGGFLGLARVKLTPQPR